VQPAADDLELVRAFQGGREAAFDELVWRYRNAVASFIVATLGRSTDVEDLSQEVFLRVHQALPRFKPSGSFPAWLYRITINLCRDEIRKKRLRRFLSLDEMEPSEPAFKDASARSDSVTMAREEREVILNALGKVNEKYRTALVLREYEDMSYGEIASVLGISEQAVKSRIFRAREQLRDLLKDYFKERL
jgi:RNA polymerase sigma-70 factor, ECF subfamily